MSWLDDNDGDKKEFPLIPEGPVALKLFDCELDETGNIPKLIVKYKVKDGGQKWVFLDFTDSRKKFIQWQMGVLGAQSLVKKTLDPNATLTDYTRALVDAIGELLGNHYMGECEHYTSDKTGKTYDNIVVKDFITEKEFNQFKMGPANTVGEPPKPDMDEQLPWDNQMFRDMGVIINGIKYEVDQSPPSPAWVRVSYSNVNGVKKHTIPAMEPYEFNLLVDFLVSVKDNYIKHEKKEHL